MSVPPPAPAPAFADSTPSQFTNPPPSLGGPVTVPDSAAADSAGVEEEGAAVGTVSVAGNLRTDADRILRTFEMPAGMRYSRDAVSRGIRKLLALGLFDDVWVEKGRAHQGVVDLVIHVAERPRISRVEFTGNRKKETEDLEKKLTVHAGEVYSPTVVETQVDSLLRYYHDEGYARAAIRAETDTTGQRGGVLVRLVIQEGEKVKITKIVFEGATAFTPKVLKKKIKTKSKGFFGGGDVKEDEDFPQNKEKLEDWYRSKGWRDMRVLAQDVQPGAEPRKLTLVIRVDEGIRYRSGTVSWTGNSILPTEDLTRLWPRKPNPWYDASRIERAQGDGYAAYAERGYLSMSIDPDETVRDSNVVDVTYRVTEGRPSDVRFVAITGNRGTREKVLRRELEMHEGERFRRSALVRTHDRLMRLGLFEEVTPDLASAESTDVDVILKVREKQVGTASAGAGYTAESGVTGFLELGHNNVLGNGQALSLHLERGARISNYFLSFTEPWFRDTPTLLGFSVYNTSTERDLYRERRQGASGRIGRPLPWPDFSRGSISYRLEDVIIDQVDTAAVARAAGSTQSVLAGFNSGVPVRTSATDLDFTRNNTDNAFYPTRGSRLTVSSELAGGPFGGQVNFHKHRLEGRWYLRSLVKGVTTMVRMRAGILDRYADQNQPVPVYERFRLGGGTTADPLRGYDDYQVVPDKFDYLATTRYISGIDSVTTPGVRDTLYGFTTSRIRYPGGRYMSLYTVEQQFPIVHPLHGVLFFDAGNTWDELGEIRPLDLKMGAGIGFRLEIPLLGNVGFDWGYGFNRDDGPRARGHFLIGNVNF